MKSQFREKSGTSHWVFIPCTIQECVGNVTTYTLLSTLVPEAFFCSLLVNFVRQTPFFILFLLLARSAESAESAFRVFRIGLALRSALRVANFQIKKDNISKESLWDQGTNYPIVTLLSIKWSLAWKVKNKTNFKLLALKVVSVA